MLRMRLPTEALLAPTITQLQHLHVIFFLSFSICGLINERNSCQKAGPIRQPDVQLTKNQLLEDKHWCLTTFGSKKQCEELFCFHLAQAEINTHLEQAAPVLQLPMIYPECCCSPWQRNSLSVFECRLCQIPTSTHSPFGYWKNTPPTTPSKHAHDEYTCPFSHIHALVTSTAELCPVTKAAVLVIAVGLVYTGFFHIINGGETYWHISAAAPCKQAESKYI